MTKADRELVILVGMPGSGKTTYCQTVLTDYVRISQDDGPHTYHGVLRQLGELIFCDESRIVIDRTNPNRHQRHEFAAIAHQAGYRVKIVYFDIPEGTCLKRIRSRSGHPTLRADRMQKAMATYRANLTVPTAEECDELVIVR